MNEVLQWLGSHENLAGWAQFFGAMLALLVTYLTAFAPVWRRKRQLRQAGQRLLAHGYEALESYHRTSAYFDPFPLSIRQASLSIGAVVDEMSRFPIYDLDDHGTNSLARRLVAMGVILASVRLFLDTFAGDLEGREPTREDKETLRNFVANGLSQAEALIKGKPLERPEWPTNRG